MVIMRAALVILILLLIISAVIGIVVILVGSFDETEIKVLITCGVLCAYTALMTPSLFHIGQGRYSNLTRIAISSTSTALVMLLYLVWGREGQIGGESYFRFLASLGVLSVATSHALILLITRSTKLIVKVFQQATVSIVVLVTIFFLVAIWNDGLPEPLLRVFFALVVLDALGSIATPVVVKSVR